MCSLFHYQSLNHHQTLVTCLVPATKVNSHVLKTAPNSLFKMSFVNLKGIVFNTISITVCQDIADSMDNGDRIDAIVIDFSKAFDLVPHDRLLMKIAISGVDSRVVAWVREFLLGRMQRVRVEGQLSG